MKSREDVIKENVEPGQNYASEFSKEEVMMVMDIYGDEQRVEFLNWFLINVFIKPTGQMTLREKVFGAPEKHYTIRELSQMFKESTMRKPPTGKIKGGDNE